MSSTTATHSFDSVFIDYSLSLKSWTSKPKYSAYLSQAGTGAQKKLRERKNENVGRGKVKLHWQHRH